MVPSSPITLDCVKLTQNKTSQHTFPVLWVLTFLIRRGRVTAHSCLNENATVKVGHPFPIPNVYLKDFASKIVIVLSSNSL